MAFNMYPGPSGRVERPQTAAPPGTVDRCMSGDLANLADIPIVIQAFIRDTCEISNLVNMTFE